MMDLVRSQEPSLARAWFDELEATHLDAGVLTIVANSLAQKRYLENKCTNRFVEAARELTGRLVGVAFVTREELAGPRPRADEAAHAEGAVDQDLANESEAPAESDRAAADAQDSDAEQGATGGWMSSQTPSTASNRPAAPPTHQGNGASRPKPAPAGAASPPARRNTPRYDESPLEGQTYGLKHFSPDFDFENFITGPENRLAYAACFAVATKPGDEYNPLFIHGGIGMGKTHLLQAIAQRILNDKPDARIAYLPCETFVSDYVRCVELKEMEKFRAFYRNADALIIDDIHCLGDKERTQEEFFHTFNELHQSRRQIILSSDSAPAQIPAIEERLTSRFGWGLVAQLSRPIFETRLAILRAKAKIRGFELPDDVANHMATRLVANARELEGAINTLLGHANLANRKIDLELVQELLGVIEISPAQVTLKQIIDAVSGYYRVKLADLQSPSRQKSVTLPRQVCMWLSRKLTRYSLQEIGGHFGGRDHTTVMHSVNIVDERRGIDPDFVRELDHLEHVINQTR